MSTLFSYRTVVAGQCCLAFVTVAVLTNLMLLQVHTWFKCWPDGAVPFTFHHLLFAGRWCFTPTC